MSWKIGNVKVTRVIEVDLPTPAGFVLPDAVPENIGKIPWLAPHFVEPDGMLKMAIQALIIESQGRKILVDTCLGNDKTNHFPELEQHARARSCRTSPPPATRASRSTTWSALTCTSTTSAGTR